MVIRERLVGAVTNVHRMALRRIPLVELEKACRDLGLGRSEWYVCTNLGVRAEDFQDVLQLAVEEALWERGRLGLSKAEAER